MTHFEMRRENGHTVNENRMEDFELKTEKEYDEMDVEVFQNLCDTEEDYANYVLTGEYKPYWVKSSEQDSEDMRASTKRNEMAIYEMNQKSKSDYYNFIK